MPNLNFFHETLNQRPSFPSLDSATPRAFILLLCSHLCYDRSLTLCHAWVSFSCLLYHQWLAELLGNGAQQMKSMYGMHVGGPRHSIYHGKRISLPESPTWLLEVGKNRLAHHLPWLFSGSSVTNLKMQSSQKGSCKSKRHISDLWALHKLLMVGRNWLMLLYPLRH